MCESLQGRVKKKKKKKSSLLKIAPENQCVLKENMNNVFE